VPHGRRGKIFLLRSDEKRDVSAGGDWTKIPKKGPVLSHFVGGKTDHKKKKKGGSLPRERGGSPLALERRMLLSESSSRERGGWSGSLVFGGIRTE